MQQQLFQIDSKERVAFDLMQKVLTYETKKQKDRKYIITLYHQCLELVSGSTLEETLKLSEPQQ